MGTDVVGCLACVDAAGPVGEERHADAAFPQVAFVAAQGAGAVEEAGLMAAFVMRAVVAGEEDEGVVGNFQFIKQVK